MPLCSLLRHQARNRSGQVGYVPEKYLQLPSSNSLLSMLQSLAALDARSHSSSNSTEPELEPPPAAAVNGDSSGETRRFLALIHATGLLLYCTVPHSTSA